MSRRLPILVLVLLLLLAGCGGARSGAPSDPTTVASGALVPPTSAAPTTAAPPAAPTLAYSGPFTTPSTNIGCYLSVDDARCDIAQRDWPPPHKPASCQLDYGNGMEVNASGAHVTCAGDTALNPTSRVIAYGTIVQQGDFGCDVEIAGITCKDTATAHGFFLSCQRYQLF